MEVGIGIDKDFNGIRDTDFFIARERERNWWDTGQLEKMMKIVGGANESTEMMTGNGKEYKGVQCNGGY